MTRLILIALSMTLASCASMEMGARHSMIVDGYSISYVESQSDAPTVVFESGLGDGLDSWADVYEEVQAFAGVFAYSRPGYSPGLRLPRLGSERTADDSAKLLRDILAKSGQPAPYILVGHSIGGLYVLEFARDYPELVAGLVLVDARLPGFTDICEAADIGMCTPPAAMVLLSPPHVAAELRGIRSSEASAPTPADIGDMQTVLLAATKPPPGAPSAAQPLWLDVQQKFAAALVNGALVTAEGSGHYVQRDAPGLVIDAIRSLVTAGIPEGQ